MTDATTDDTDGQDDRFDRAFPLNTDSPHAQATLEAGDRVRFYLVDAIGMDAARLGALLPTVQAELADQGLIPVFVTDLLDYAPLREAGVIFEAVPPVADSTRLAPHRNWAARQAEVVEMIRNKWQPSGEVRLGAG